MNCRGVTLTIIPILFSVAGYAANPLLNISDDKPVAAKFGGTEME
jgi:hypothetical protein